MFTISVPGGPAMKAGDGTLIERSQVGGAGEFDLPGIDGKTIRDALEQQGLQIVKAMDTTQSAFTNPSLGPRSLHPAIGESLDPVMWAYTLQYPYHTPFYNSLRRSKANSLIEEYNRLKSLGDSGSFFEEGGLPREATSEYERLLARVKFMGQMGRVTGPMQAAGMNFWGSSKAREMWARTARMMLDTEEACLWGDTALQAFEFDGVIPQIMDYADTNSKWSDMVLDCRGEPLDQRWIDESLGRVWQGDFGFVDEIWTDGKSKMYLDAQQGGVRRVVTSGESPNITRGTIADLSHTSFGDVKHYPDIFLAPRRPPRTAAGQCESGVPSAPGTLTAVAQTLGTTAATQGAPPYRQAAAANGGNGVPIGTYTYSVSACNAYGESVETAHAAVAVSATGKEVKITFTGPSDSGSAARSRVAFYKVYRSETSTGARKYLCSFPKSGGDAAAQTLIDDGTFLPGCSTAFVIRKEVLSWRPLLAPVTYDLAKIDDSHRWMHVQYATLIHHAPIHSRVIINIGTPPMPGEA